MGHLTDTKGKQRVILIGVVIFIIVSSLYNVAFSVTLLLILRVVNGIAFSAMSTANGAAAADVLPKSRLSEGLGFYFLGLAAATAVGPALGIYIVENLGFNMFFVFALVMNVLELLVVLFFDYEKKNNVQKDAEEKNKQKFDINNYFEKTAIRPAIVMVLVALSNGSVISFMTVFGSTRDIGNVGLFFTVYALAVIASRFAIGKLIKRFGVTKTLTPAMILCGSAFIMLAFTYNLPMLIAVALAYGFGNGVITPIISIIVFRRSPSDKRGAANGTLYAALDIGIGLGAFLWGVISVNAGFTFVYLLSAVCVFASLLAYYLLLHNTVD